MTRCLLSVQHLTMHYTTRRGDVAAVDDVSFDLHAGESLGLVGESGCGKTSVASCLLRILPENARILGGRIFVNGANVNGADVNGSDVNGSDLVALSEVEMQKYRWRRIAMVFQAAMNALDPVYRVGDQIIEALETHTPAGSPAQHRRRVAQLFQIVGLDPILMDRYPHEYSGGMRQRAVIAMALACNPDVIIADEPTTALDVIVQDKLLREMCAIQQQIGMGMIYISHDVAVIAEVSNRMGVMYAGRLVEMADTIDIFERPLHPYTHALMSAFPSITGPKRTLSTLPGEPPDLLHPPPGCRFHPRCPYATSVCAQDAPPLASPLPLLSGERTSPVHAPGASEVAGAAGRHQHLAACWHPMGGTE